MRMPYYDYVIRKDNPVGLVQGYKSLGFYTVDDFNVSADGVWTLKDGIPDNTACNYSAGCAKAYKLPAGQKAFPGAQRHPCFWRMRKRSRRGKAFPSYL